MEQAASEEIDEPWLSAPYFASLPFHDLSPNGLSRFLKPDIWHTIHLGVGKDFISSSIAVLEKALPGRSIPARFAQLERDYFDFCTETRRPKYLTKVNKHTFNCLGNVEPAATWNKAQVTATMGCFLEHVCQRYKNNIDAMDDSRTRYIATWPFFAALLVDILFVSKSRHLCRTHL